MIRVSTLPGSLRRVLEPFRPCFTTPTFTTFVTLLAGMIVRPGQRTVCGMLAGAGLAGVWHHSRAHRFFAAARWRPDAVGLTVLRLIVGHLTPVGAPLLIAVDDTLFRRCGRKVFAAHWDYDGSLKVAKGNQKLSRGNTFVVAAVVVELPFLDRPVALPVLARLWRRGGPTKTMLARELIELIAAAAGRIVHVVGDGGYVCTELRHLPPNVTLTGPLPSHASLWHVNSDLDQPPRMRRRGRPRVYGAHIGTPAELAAATPATPMTVTRYGRATTVQLHLTDIGYRLTDDARSQLRVVMPHPDAPDLLRSWHEQLASLATTGNRIGYAGMASTAHAQISIAATIGRRSRSARRREALIARALWAEFLSWIDEQSDAVEADAWLRHVQQHAVEANAPTLTSYVLMRQSQRALERFDPGNAIALAQRALEEVRLPGRVHALLLIRQAQAYAMGG